MMMRRWLSIALVPLLSACIPIGIRGQNMPYASFAPPLHSRCHLSQATQAADPHRGDAGSGQPSFATRAMSASTIRPIKVSSSVELRQPSFVRAFSGFPQRTSTSAGRYSFGSITTHFS